MNEWDNEPDSFAWVDEITGYQCYIKRNMDFKNLCGYVGIPESHPWYGQPYNARVKAPEAFLEEKVNIDEVGVINVFLETMRQEDDGLYSIASLIRCHGGITYDGDTAPDHTLEGYWWFGFDCAHYEDMLPGFTKYGVAPRGVYRNFEFVRMICTGMAEQLFVFERAYGFVNQ